MTIHDEIEKFGTLRNIGAALVQYTMALYEGKFDKVGRRRVYRPAHLPPGAASGLPWHEACDTRHCEHPAHVRPRRELRSKRPHDLRHLGACILDDPECSDDSHLLPPRPLDVAVEYCCQQKCFPCYDVPG